MSWRKILLTLIATDDAQSARCPPGGARRLANSIIRGRRGVAYGNDVNLLKRYEYFDAYRRALSRR
ncbi:Hypothetical protein ETEE_1026 [Edwardsiella anguillarum ET080813]|uniref:Uncharacterized protein n=1 Tax=Edwardsiella anguillarum ET080813 TaxID=667120 RepID=A0A076LHG4_9GAMM|nr:Hypothetical protein ETEE_1026 [Edwardsiella anguillarum ET080813]